MAIMTEKFVTAAQLMAQVMGLPDYVFVTIPHPLSSASEAALEKAAAATITAMTELLLLSDS